MRRAAGWRGVAVLAGALALLGLGAAALSDVVRLGLGLGWSGMASQLFMGAGFWLGGFALAGLVSNWFEAGRGKLAVPPAWWLWVLVRLRWCGCLLLGHRWRWPHPAGRRPVCRRCGAVGRRERSTMRGCELREAKQ